MFGRVEWFNFKKGFGNIKVVDPSHDMNDKTFFVNYSNINANASFKRLYPGEYVSFELGKHQDKDICTNVTGINGGPLLVENTEFSYRVIKSYDNSNDENAIDSQPNDTSS
jgi:cold shock CspA family protein